MNTALTKIKTIYENDFTEMKVVLLSSVGI
jgi:hypothetical protein